MDPRLNNILSERDEKKHADMRAKMIGAVRHEISRRLLHHHSD
jgi:hypothetical protein